MSAFDWRAAPEQLEDLHRRLDASRLPEAAPAPGWSQGVPREVIEFVLDHWRHRYDWRETEARLATMPQRLIRIDGLQLHVVHLRSGAADAVPIVLTHG